MVSHRCASSTLVRAVFGHASFVLGSEASYAGWHRSLPAALAAGLLVAIDEGDNDDAPDDRA